jgi:hypothetical protein
VLKLGLDILDHLFDGAGGDGALGAGLAEAGLQLLTVEFFPPIILLGNQQGGRLYALVGREAHAATPALPPPPDATLGFPGVSDLGVGMSAIGTTHYFIRFLKIILNNS